MKKNIEQPYQDTADFSCLQQGGGGENEEQRVQPLPSSQRNAKGIGYKSTDQNVVEGFPRDEGNAPERGISEDFLPASPFVEGTTCADNVYVFQIHAARAVDPLIGEMFVCPQTLEAVSLHRMLGLPLSFTWEQIPFPFLSWRGGPSSRSWWPPASSGPALPAAIDPRTGVVMSGYSLLEALRSFAHSQVHAPELHMANCSSHAPAQECSGPVTTNRGEFALNAHIYRHCFCRSCPSASLEQATELAVTELVQQAVEIALRFYMWRDEKTFRCFTKPMLENTFGRVYGKYYCWTMRRTMGAATAAHISPRILPEDLRRRFPNSEDSVTTNDAATVEELLAVDSICRALRAVEQLLQGKLYLGGQRASVLDATVFAHLAILFSVPFPDRGELQRVLLNSGSLVQYCRRVQEVHHIWPVGPSFLFGVSSLSEMARGTPLFVHSWRQQRVNSRHDGYEEEVEGSNEGQVRRILLWLGSAACCAIVLVAAGKTPFVVTKTRLPRRSSVAHVANNG